MFRKLCLLMVILLGVQVLYSQNAKVVSAYNYLRYYQKDPNLKDISNAKAAIDAASEHEKSSGMAKTWLYRGNIYLAIAKSKDSLVNNLEPNAAWMANEAYEKLNTMEDKRLDVRDVPLYRQQAAYEIYFQGADYFKAADYKKAFEMFDKVVKIKKDYDVLDTVSAFNAGLALQNMGEPDQAMTYYQQCMDAGFGGAATYKTAAEMFAFHKNQEKAVEILKQGRTKYPDDTDLLFKETDIYLANKEYDKALENLNLAVEKAPENPDLIYIRGTIHYEREEFDKAEDDYRKAIEIQPDHFDAIFNLGILFFNQGADMTSVIKEIKDNTKYAAEKKKADALFEKALPFLEKAHQINPTDKDTMKSLKQIYALQGNQAKFDEINEKLTN